MLRTTGCGVTATCTIPVRHCGQIASVATTSVQSASQQSQTVAQFAANAREKLEIDQDRTNPDRAVLVARHEGDSPRVQERARSNGKVRFGAS